MPVGSEEGLMADVCEYKEECFGSIKAQNFLTS
jgi:hypothetical protein